MQQISRGKFDCLQRTTAGFTRTHFDGYGLCCSLPTRPQVLASYPVLVHRRTPLLHASFRPHLAMTPLRFANPSPPSGWVEDFHLQAVVHTRHTTKRAAFPAARPVHRVDVANPTPPRVSLPARRREPRRRPALRTWRSSSGTCRPVRGRSCRIRPCRPRS